MLTVKNAVKVFSADHRIHWGINSMNCLAVLARADAAVLTGLLSLLAAFFLSLYQLVRPKGKR